jgi:hypothetical protein
MKAKLHISTGGLRSRRTTPFCLLRLVRPLWMILVALYAAEIHAEEIDRLLAAVNGKIVTQGDLLLGREMNAIFSAGEGKAPPSGTEEISRLIDLELMRQELENFPVAPEEQGKIQARLEELRKAFAPVGGLSGLLRSHGLQESELLDYLRLQDSILRFVDFRFRPFAGVSAQAIQRYYTETLVPPLQKAGAPIPPLAEVSGKIEEILREEQVNASLNQWIQDVRSHSRIEFFLDGAEAPRGNK